MAIEPSASYLLRMLHADPTTHDIPVLVVTADSSPAIPGEARRLGARAVLTKPIDANEFADLIKSILG